jgi:AcrR family transcriptional regulator
VSAAAVSLLRPRNDTEAAILDAARAALADEGYDALTMNGLARRAFVSRTNLYFYFANKRAVLPGLGIKIVPLALRLVPRGFVLAAVGRFQLRKR